MSIKYYDRQGNYIGKISNLKEGLTFTLSLNYLKNKSILDILEAWNNTDPKTLLVDEHGKVHTLEDFLFEIREYRLKFMKGYFN